MNAAVQTPSNEDLSRRFSDATKLAKLGELVRFRLAGIPEVQKVDVSGAELFLVPGFMDPRDCREVVRVIDRKAEPSTLYDGQGNEGFRTSFTHHFDPDDPLTEDIELYISDLLGIDDDYSEIMQGQRYKPGQEFKAHHDFFHLGERYWRDEALRGGQRTWTAMVFLDEPREGGCTQFPLLDVTIRLQCGMLAIWNNMDLDGRPNMKTLHAGMPVIKGVKHVITKWYRQEAWRQLNPL
ncbi:2OG-Fe(II) oxygenase [Altererythrobacter salegens]|uniref:2OG-Fe(II) oxygenase n=1 Tax=Croceibacterium salegens TaxID=1737568 RepID=A0A6I4SSW7_9SPHN|nr:2OG-Fe(II) oxygenase [Croceibacterium salegens]MXO59044.1 2OG-Fe(II) oxygenase [Croceibacterium salegens]